MEKKRLSVRPIVLGLAAAMGAYLVLLTLAAYLTVSGRLVRIGQAVWACACLSAFGGAMMTLRGKRGVAALPLLATAAFWACVSLLGLLASDAPDLNGVLGLLAASALGGLLAAGLARRRLFSFTAGSWVVGMIDQIVDTGFIKVRELDQGGDGNVDISALVVGISRLMDLKKVGKLFLG